MKRELQGQVSLCQQTSCWCWPAAKEEGPDRICRDLARCLNCSGTQWCLTSVTKHSTCLALIQSKFSGGFSRDSVMFPYGGSNAIQCDSMQSNADSAVRSAGWQESAIHSSDPPFECGPTQCTPDHDM